MPLRPSQLAPRTGRSGAAPGGQGISNEKAAADRVGARQEHRVEDRAAGTGHSSPIVWGDRIFLTAAIEGESLPGAKAAAAHARRASRRPSRQRRGRSEAHVQGARARREDRQDRLGADARTKGRSTTRGTAAAASPAPTAATDGKMVFAYFGPEGLYAYDFTGKLAWKAVEKFPTLGLGTGTSPVLHQNLVIIQRDEDNGEQSASSPTTRRPARKPGGRSATCRSAGRRRCSSTPAAAPSSSPTARVRHRLRPGDRQGAVADARGREQRHPHAARRQRPGDRDGGLTRRRRSSRSGPATVPADKRVAWDTRRAPATCSRTSSTATTSTSHRQRHRHLPRRRDRRGQVRGRPPAEAGALHGFAGRLQRARSR